MLKFLMSFVDAKDSFVNGDNSSDASAVGCSSRRMSAGSDSSISVCESVLHETCSAVLTSANNVPSFDDRERSNCGEAAGIGIAILNTSLKDSTLCGLGQGSAPFFCNPVKPSEASPVDRIKTGTNLSVSNCSMAPAHVPLY